MIAKTNKERSGIMNNLNKKQKITLVIIVIIVILAICYYMNLEDKKEFEQIQQNELEVAEVGATNIENEDSKKTTIKVHITGAVMQEGVIELIENSRISDAIEKAGGLKEDAYLGSINLAYVLEDGMKIYIPNNQEKEKIEKENLNVLQETERSNINNSDNTNIINSKTTDNKQNKNSKININLATQSELELLPGIGPSTALKIINYRKEKGRFKKIDDIKQVNGIGDSKFNKIKDLLVVN